MNVDGHDADRLVSGFPIPTTEHETRAAATIAEAFREDDVYRPSSMGAMAARAIMDRPPETRPTEAMVETSLATAYAAGWDRDRPETFAGRLGILVASVNSNASMLQQLTLRRTDPGRVDYEAVTGLPADTPEERKWGDDQLDAELADPVAMANRRALAAGRFADTSEKKRDELLQRLQDPGSSRLGRRAVEAFGRQVSMEERARERHEARVDPVRHYDAILQRGAEEAIVHVARMNDEERRRWSEKGMSRTDLEIRRMEEITVDRFDPAAMKGYNHALHLRSGTRPHDAETQAEYARMGVPSEPSENLEWRTESLDAARRRMTLEGIPERLGRIAGSSELPIESTYAQNGMISRISRAVIELGVTPDMVGGRDETASLARMLHVHAPQALDMAMSGKARVRANAGGGDALHEDVSDHMTRGDFRETRRDLERMRVAAERLVHRASQGTRELLGLGGAARGSQLEGLIIEAERRAPPMPELVAERGSTMAPALAAAMRSFGARGMG